MLSRVAASVYWMCRYVERAENIARFLEVNLNLMLDAPDSDEQQWMPLVYTSGDQEDFEERYGEDSQDHVVRFLAFDPDNPNSILSCLRAARESARSVREIISTTMWRTLNEAYLTVRDTDIDPSDTEALTNFFSLVRRNSNTFAGVMDSTMTRSDGWHFGFLGRMLERADKTSRILDVKYFILHRSLSDVGGAIDDIQWASILRSASAYEMYRKRRGRITPQGIVEFLMLDHEFPRAIHYCLNVAMESLARVSGNPGGPARNDPERFLGQLCSDLSYTGVDEILSNGLHEYVDRLQIRMNQIGAGIHDTFFAIKAPKLRTWQWQTQ